MDRLIRRLEHLKRRLVPIHYDATFHPAERYYTEVYLGHIGPLLDGLGEALRVLDAGCGTGRLLVPLAQQGHHMTAIDFHRDSLRIARRNAERAGVEQPRTRVGCERSDTGSTTTGRREEKSRISTPGWR